MKRVYSFLVMCFTILILVIANVPNIKENKKLSSQFEEGSELVYRLSSHDDKELTTAQIEETIDILNERIDSKGLGLLEISYLGNDYLRVVIPERDYEALGELDEIISNNVVVTVGVNNANGKYVDIYDDVHDVFKLENDDDIVFQVDSSYQYQLVFKLKDEAYEKLSNYDKAFVTVYTDYYDEENRDLEENRTQYEFSVDSKKVYFSSYEIETLSNQLYDMRYGCYPLDIEYYAVYDVAPTTASSTNSFTFLIVATLVALAAICFVLIKKYKHSGILATILTVCSVIFSALSFNYLGGQYDTLTCIAYIMGVVIGVDLFVAITQKVRNELYKGKKEVRAFKEGFSRSIMMIFDITVVYIIIILVMYFAGNFLLKNVSLMLMSTFVSNLLFMVFGYLVVGSFMLPSSKLINKNVFNINQDMIADISRGETSRYEEIRVIKSRKQISKRFLPITMLVVLVGSILFGTLTAFDKNGFNYTSEVSTSYVLRITTPLTSELDSEKDVLSLLRENHISVPYSKKEYGISVNPQDEVEGESKYFDTIGIVTFYSNDKKLLKYEDRIKEVIEMRLGSEYEEDMVYADELHVTGVQETALNILKVSAIIILVVFIYVIFRFRISMVLGTIVSSLISSLAFLALMAIIRIPFNYITMMVALMTFIISILYSTSLFEKARELTRLNKKYSVLNEEQSENIATGLTNSITYRFQYSLLAFVILIVVSLLVVRGNMFFNYVAYLLGVVIALLSTLFIALPVWRKTDNKVKPLSLKGKLRRDRKKARVKKSTEPEEFIFTGIND